MAEYVLTSDLNLKRVEPQADDPDRFLDHSSPAETRRMPRRGAAFSAAAAATGVLALFATQRADATTSFECPKPSGLLSETYPSPNPGHEPFDNSGISNIKISSLGVVDGYACAGQQETITFLAENIGTNTTSSTSFVAIGNNGLKIIPNSIYFNGQSAGEACDYTDATTVGCRLDENMLPSEQHYVSLRVLRDTAGTGSIDAMSYGSSPEQDMLNNSTKQAVSVYAGRVVTARTSLAKPVLFYTDRIKKGAKKGVRSCRESTLVVKIAPDQPPADDVVLQLNPKNSNVKFKKDRRAYTFQRRYDEVNRQSFAFSAIRACTVGRRSAVTHMTVTGANTDRTSWRLSFSPVTNKWTVRKAKVPTTPTVSLPTRSR